MSRNDEDEDLEDKDESVEEPTEESDTEVPPEKEKAIKEEPESTDEDKDFGKEFDDSEDTGDNEADESRNLPGAVDQALKDDKQEKPKPTEFGNGNLLSDENNAVERENTDDLEAPITRAVANQNPQLDRYQQFLDDYKKLQDQRRKGDLVNGLIAAGGKIGQSMAGKYSGNFVPDQNGNQMLAKMNERPTQDFEQNQVVQGRELQLQSEMSAHDRKSPQSVMVRNYLNQRLGMNLPDTVSASDAQMLMRTVGRPQNSKFQSKTGVYIDDDGKEHKILASYDPSSGKIYNTTTHQEIPNDRFVPEGLNPYQIVKGEHGQQEQFNKSRGGTPTNVVNQPGADKAANPVELYATLQPDERKLLDTQLRPAFNKETEKTRQRLTHVPVIMQRLQEAQTNPAALPQLKAELARFDVGDQRLAAQEFSMFGQRMGYQGVMDWLEAHTNGTISKDFADSMSKAITNVSNDLKGELNDKAEEQGNLLTQRTKADPKIAAKLIYGGYTTPEPKVKVRNLQTGKEGFIPKKNLKAAIASKKYQEIP